MDKKRLDGWKEISDYLGRDVRTCQRWERELKLPVYRVNQDSNRSKVFSYTTEIDEWFSLTLKNNNGEKKGLRTKKWLVPVLLIIVVVAVFFGIFSFVFNKNDQFMSLSHEASNPVRWDIKGSQIVVYDVQDNILWIKEINNSVPQESYYIFDPNFQLKYVSPSANFKRQYKSLYEEGKVELELEDFLKKCEEDVLFWDGANWITTLSVDLTN